MTIFKRKRSAPPTAEPESVPEAELPAAVEPVAEEKTGPAYVTLMTLELTGPPAYLERVEKALTPFTLGGVADLFAALARNGHRGELKLTLGTRTARVKG